MMIGGDFFSLLSLPSFFAGGVLGAFALLGFCALVGLIVVLSDKK